MGLARYTSASRVPQTGRSVEDRVAGLAARTELDPGSDTLGMSAAVAAAMAALDMDIQAGCRDTAGAGSGAEVVDKQVAGRREIERVAKAGRPAAPVAAEKSRHCPVDLVESEGMCDRSLGALLPRGRRARGRITSMHHTHASSARTPGSVAEYHATMLLGVASIAVVGKHVNIPGDLREL